MVRGMSLSAPNASMPLPKAETPVRSIMLMGKELRVKSDEDPERLRELAAYVDDTIAQVSQGKTQAPDAHLLLVALMRVAAEVYKLRDEKKELSSILKRSTRALLGRIPG